MSQRVGVYKLLFSDTNPNPLVCDSYELGSADRYFHLEGRKVETAWGKPVMYFSGGELEDFVVNPLGWPVVSERVSVTIGRLALAEVQFVPIRLLERGSLREIAGYSVLNALRVVPALDREHSVYSEVDDNSDRLVVMRPALVAHSVSGLHVFRILEQHSILFVSRATKLALESVRVSGIRFVPVPVY